MTLAQRFDRAITLAAILLTIMTVSIAVYWVKKRPAPDDHSSVVIGKRVVIDESGGAARVEYVLMLRSAPGARSDAIVPAEIYQRAEIGARVEHRGNSWIVTPR